MNLAPAPLSERIHPSLWRASQLARGRLLTVETGYPALSQELPGGGWPIGALVEVMTEHPGSGEIRLLAPALGASNRTVALVEPPREPSVQGFAYVGIPPSQVLKIRAKRTSDQLWSAEQILKASSCGAVLLWQTHVRSDALRRLLLAARSTTSLFYDFRPTRASIDASPADLRIAVQPVEECVRVDIVKRKGPRHEGELTVTVQPRTALMSQHGRTLRATIPVDLPIKRQLMLWLESRMLV
jgi:protein ImuA